MEIGVFFFDKISNTFGISLFQDGNVTIAKYYDFSKKSNQFTFTGYAPVNEVNLICTKEKTIEYFEDKLKDISNLESMNFIQKELIQQAGSDKIEKKIIDNRNMLIELNNINKKQSKNFTENRRKQIRRILKGIRRNNKNIKRLFSSVDLNTEKNITDSQNLRNLIKQIKVF